MATMARPLAIFFLITLLFSVETLARESRFFSKVTRDSTANTKLNDVQQVKSEAIEEEQPSFLPQTSQNTPYGLGASETGDTIPVTAATTTETEFYNSGDRKNYATEPEFYNSGDGRNYATELQGADGYSLGNGNAYFYSNKKGKNYYFHGEKQGMSDTRFMENGKYFYDVNSEKNLPTYNYDAYQNNNGRRPEYYNNEGYYSGSTASFNDKYYKNNGQGQQSREEDDELYFDP